MKQIRRITLITLAVAATAGINWACSKSSDSNYGGYSNPPAAASSIQLAGNAKFGNILTDNAGRTLYFFSIDANGNSGCTSGDCIAAWPAFYIASPTLGSGLNASDFGTITRPDGSKQTTYKGWPLYYYAGDAKAGDVTGDGFGGIWFVAKPDYTVMLASTQLVGNDGNMYTSQYQVGKGATQYLTDAYGRTLYTFTPDKARKNTFTKPDFSNNSVWPIDTLTAVQQVPSVFTRAQFDTLTVFGKVQLTFKGCPLY